MKPGKEGEAPASRSTAPDADKRSRMDALANALRRKRRLEPQTQTETKETTGAEKSAAVEDASAEQLRKKAKEALLREAARSQERAKTMGPQGYLKPSCLQTNKRFLQATVRSTLFQAGEKKRTTTKTVAEKKEG